MDVPLTTLGDTQPPRLLGQELIKLTTQPAQPWLKPPDSRAGALLGWDTADGAGGKQECPWNVFFNSCLLDQLLLKDKAAPSLVGTLAMEWPCCQPD